MTPQQRERFSSESWADLLLILVCLAAFVVGWRRLSHLGEKRFRIWMGVAFGCFAIVCVLYISGAAQTGKSLIADFLYLLVYLAIFFAIESRPHLSTVYGIVNQSGGTIDVESQLGKGTTFRICFPEAP